MSYIHNKNIATIERCYIDRNFSNNKSSFPTRFHLYVIEMMDCCWWRLNMMESGIDSSFFYLELLVGLNYHIMRMKMKWKWGRVYIVMFKVGQKERTLISLYFAVLDWQSSEIVIKLYSFVGCRASIVYTWFQIQVR